MRIGVFAAVTRAPLSGETDILGLLRHSSGHIVQFVFDLCVDVHLIVVGTGFGAVSCILCFVCKCVPCTWDGITSHRSSGEG